jgi:3,4-dihydroxy-2-butanone 4-phosphate synthase
MFNTIEEAIQDIRDGKMLILVDDEDRENEGDLIVAAEKATPDVVNFMAVNARGLICVPMEGGGRRSGRVLNTCPSLIKVGPSSSIVLRSLSAMK